MEKSAVRRRSEKYQIGKLFFLIDCWHMLDDMLHVMVHVPVFTILPTCIMKQIVNFFFKSLKKTDYIVLFFFKQKVFVKEHYLFSVRYGGYVTLKHTFSVNKTFSMMNLRTVYICNVDKILDMTTTL